MSEWKRLDQDSIGQVKWDPYDDCSMGFVCSCGREVIVDVQDGVTECECGRRFQIALDVEEWIGGHR